MTVGPAPVAGPGSRAERAISYAHLVRLTDDVGLFEHAELTRPRLEHGYCVDDVARGLVIVAREPAPPAELLPLGRRYVDFVLDSLEPDGRVHNRRLFGGGWTDAAGVDDCWGRALWGLGSAVGRLPALADEARRGFERAAGQRSPALRAMAFAAMGAAEVLVVEPRHAPARALLRDAARLLDTQVMPANAATSGALRATAGGTHTSGPKWPWPEPRLRYANAVLAETLVAAGALLGDEGWRLRGLDRLAWLVDLETTTAPGGGRQLSPTPVTGWSPGEPRPGFDQQPIEAAALADACARAAELPDVADADRRRWEEDVLRCEAWFLGHNDVGAPLLDARSGGGYDGLEPAGWNENQGAESSLALLSTLQQAARVRSRAA